MLPILISAWASPRRTSCSATKSPARTRTPSPSDRKSTRLNSSHTDIYTLSLHDALPIYLMEDAPDTYLSMGLTAENLVQRHQISREDQDAFALRSEEHTSELQSH